MEISIPSLLRIKPDALHRLGKYLRNAGHERIALFYAEGMKAMVGETVSITLESSEIRVVYEDTVTDNAIELVFDSTFAIPQGVRAVVAIGGGKVVDYCKYIAFLAHLPFISVPTSISNDGFCSPVASLYVKGKRRSLQARIPAGVVVDTRIVAGAPEKYVLSGIGDMVAKVTAIRDWKLAFHARGEAVDDFAVLVAGTAAESVINARSQPVREPEFLRALAGSLVMSGVAMAICGTSRPTSGSEHLVSHAYDAVADPPSLHGVQVGVATYALSWLQSNRHDTVRAVLDETGFTAYVEANPLSRTAFVRAIELAPSVKENYYTILSEPSSHDRLMEFVAKDEWLGRVLR